MTGRRSSRHRLSPWAVAALGMLTGAMACFMAVVALVALVPVSAPKGPEFMPATASDSEMDIRQIHTHTAEVQLSPGFHRERRVAAYRLQTPDGMVHTTVNHDGSDLHGRVMYSRRRNGAFEQADPRDEIMSGWREAVVTRETRELLWRGDSEVITTLGPVKMTFFDRALDHGLERCVGFVGNARTAKRRLSGYLCRPGAADLGWDDAVAFLQHLEVSGQRVVI